MFIIGYMIRIYIIYRIFSISKYIVYVCVLQNGYIKYEWMGLCLDVDLVGVVVMMCIFGFKL